MKIVTEKETQAQVAQLQILVRCGSLLDPARLSGLAYFTGRALMRGTRQRSYRDLISSIERLGASVSVRTDQDLTVLRASVLVRNFDALLELLREVLTQPAFDLGEVSTLRSILQGELRASLQDPQELASRAVLHTAYQGTPAQRPPQGTVESLSRITPADLAAFFTAHYSKGNLVVGVMSPFEDADVAALIKRSFSSLPDGESKPLDFPSLTFSGHRAVVVDRRGMATSPVFIAIPGVGDADSDLSPLEVGNFVFGEAFTSRLMQDLRAEHGWTYGVSSGYRQIIISKASPTLFSLYLFPSAEYAALAIPKAISMLQEYARDGITQVEFAQARESLGNSYAFKVATAEQRLGLRVRQILTGRVYESTKDFADRLAGITLDGINAVIRSRTSLDRLLVAAVGDAELLRPILAAIPTHGQVEVVLPDQP